MLHIVDRTFDILEYQVVLLLLIDAHAAFIDQRQFPIFASKTPMKKVSLVKMEKAPLFQEIYQSVTYQLLLHLAWQI